MCGVVGCYGRPSTRDEQLTALRRGMRAILHRGPEEVGYYVDPTVTLGTVRLSIVDLLLGKQPMMTADGRYVIGFNGEIFNFVELRDELRGYGIEFVTRSDTEVLLQSLAHWGVPGALHRLNGQFGFAFYDRVTGELVLGRDPFGERPMYYAVRNRVCYFASEVKGIFAFPEVPRALDPDRVVAAGRLWTPIPDETCFAGVECLPQGHYASIRSGQVTVTKYYHALESTPRAELAGLDIVEGQELLSAALRDSVRLRLRGDYPLGAFVSGGLDSAVVVANMQELLATQLRTFSIQVDVPAVDETVHQEKMVAAFGLDHSSVLVRSTDIRERFPKVVEQCEVPLHRAAPVACGMLAELVGGSGVRIVLGGEGADELFLGYDITKEAAIVDGFLAGEPQPSSARRLEGSLTDLRHTMDIRGADILAFYQDAQARGRLTLGAHQRRFDAERLGDLVIGARGDDYADERLLGWVGRSAPDFTSWSWVDRAQWLDIHTLFIGYGMTCHGDRPGTGCGVETRFPFLDPAVVALAARMPADWKLRAGQEKHILREAYRDRLPADVVDRPKFGMRVPSVAAMLPGTDDDWVDEVLSPTSLAASTVLDQSTVERLVGTVTASGGTALPYPLNHTYLQVLSVLLLEKIMVRDYRVPDHDLDRVMHKRIDGHAAPIGRGAA